MFLVAHHLTHVAHRPAPRHRRSRRRSSRSPRSCGTPERLRMLYLLTCADMRAVGPGVMTGWQAQILWELYARTLARLTGGRAERPDARRAWPSGCWRRMRGDGPRRAVPAHLAMMSDRYLATTRPQRIAAHLRLRRAARGRSVVATELFHHPDLGSSELVVVTRDVPGLFSLIAGTLAAQRHQHPLRPDPHARRRHRHRHLPGQRSLRRGGDRGGALAADARGAAPRAARRADGGGAARAAPGGQPGRRGRGRARPRSRSTTSSRTPTPWSR